MKVEELMIGDYVRVPLELDRIKRIKNTFDMDDAILYDPIQITEDILNKNCTYNQEMELYTIGEISMHLEDNIVTVGIVRCGFIGDDFYPIADIQYVHELQHIMKVFKIKKDIYL